MNIRHPFVKLAALGVLVTALPLLMAPSGGYPTRPRFQGVGVQTTAPLTGAKIAVGSGNTDPGWDVTAGGGAIYGKNGGVLLYSGGGIDLTENAYWDGTNWRCNNNTQASFEVFTAGAVGLAYAPACATAGSIITFVNAFQIDLNGNITSATAGTVPWSKTYSLIANVAGVGPTMVSCTNCGANSIARSAAGIYSITIAPGVLVTWACGMRNVSGNAPGVEVSLGSVSSTTIPVNLFSFAGALADGAAGTQISCTGAL